MLPQLFAARARDFSLSACRFCDEPSKLGSGRRGVAAMTGKDTLCYTLELSFFPSPSTAEEGYVSRKPAGLFFLLVPAGKFFPVGKFFLWYRPGLCQCRVRERTAMKKLKIVADRKGLRVGDCSRGRLRRP